MKTFTILVLSIIVCLVSNYSAASSNRIGFKVGSCGYANVTVMYKQRADYLIGCEGIARAKSFFTNYGYAVDVPIRLYFKQRVLVDISLEGEEQKQIYGCFDPRTMSVIVSSLSSAFVTDAQKAYFRIGQYERTENGEEQRRSMLKVFHRSIITHEVAHLYAQHNFNLKSSKTYQNDTMMGHGVHEYVASVVQLNTIEPTIREHILQSYPPEIMIDDERQISVVLYSCDPEMFCIMSFRHFHSMTFNQQRIFLDRIFSNNLNPDQFLDFNQ